MILVIVNSLSVNAYFTDIKRIHGGAIASLLAVSNTTGN